MNLQRNHAPALKTFCTVKLAVYKMSKSWSFIYRRQTENSNTAWTCWKKFTATFLWTKMYKMHSSLLGDFDVSLKENISRTRSCFSATLAHREMKQTSETQRP